MSGCCYPHKAFKTGCLTEKGKDDYVIASGFHGDFISLDKVNKPVDLSKCDHDLIDGHVCLTNPIQIPCGVCVGCRMAKAKEWKIRNCLELQSFPEAYFLTLTYDNAHLPINELGEPYLKKRDYQLFLKLLRRRLGFVRYFGCGEYGENFHRPHFHFLLYCHLSDLRLVGVRKYQSDLISSCWTHGLHMIENVTPGSIAYVSGYVEKKQRDPAWNSYPVKPFITMSRKPGIGMAYLAENYETVKSTQKVYGLFADGSKSTTAPLPQSFKRVLDGVPWFEQWKDAAKLSGESLEEVLKVVFGTENRSLVGLCMEEVNNIKLDRLRKAKL